MATEDSQQYGKLSRAMCKDKRITDADRTLYAFIKSYINWRVCQTQIASELGISLSKVKRSINRLDAAGYLKYDIKETQNKQERRNITMLDQPKGWAKNEPHVGQNWTTNGSEMNHQWVKNEPPDGSKMNHNKANDKANPTGANPTEADLDIAGAEISYEDLSKLWSAKRMMDDVECGIAFDDDEVLCAKATLVKHGEHLPLAEKIYG